jgi:hypothetical protein
MPMPIFGEALNSNYSESFQVWMQATFVLLNARLIRLQ